MTKIFLALAVNSLRGGVLILVILILRLLLRRTSRRVFSLLWGIVCLRLLLPVKLTAFFGLLPGKSAAAFFTAKINESALAGELSGEAFMPTVQTAGRPFSFLSVLPWIWLTGTALILLRTLVRTIRLRRSLSDAVPLDDGVWYSDRIRASFAFGLIRPRIYLPSGLDKESVPWVLAHEKAHLRSCDICRKTLGFLILGFYWFQPLCWLGWAAFCRDLELACDERAVRGLSFSDRKSYAMALLRCGASAEVPGTASFGEKPVSTRIHAVLQYRKQPSWAAALAGIACTLLVFALFFEAPASAQESVAQEIPQASESAAVSETPELPEIPGPLRTDEEPIQYCMEVDSNETERYSFSSELSEEDPGRLSIRENEENEIILYSLDLSRFIQEPSENSSIAVFDDENQNSLYVTFGVLP